MSPFLRSRLLAAAAITSLLVGTKLRADVVPQGTGSLPYAFTQVRARNPRAFTYKRALVQQARRTQVNRLAALSQTMSSESIAASGGTVVSGTRQIPVLPFKFKNSGADPFAQSALQNRLFGPTGETMTKHYLDMSYGLLTVKGEVRNWVTVQKNDTFYEGPDFLNPQGHTEHCYGICNKNKLGDAIKEVVSANDAQVDFGQFDNDGPDGVPNSGDDDGYVDFIALVHSEVGGECNNGNRNIWSHRYTMSDLTGLDLSTNDNSKSGGKIKIDDYVVMPALNCNGTSMIDIGVFSHEFGHAFGLPDLYDTDSKNGESQGDGLWCLMAAGSWGGDGSTKPNRPVHMSAWAKTYLGWLQPRPAPNGQTTYSLPPVQAGRTNAVKLAVSANVYYLIEYRAKQGFDADLPADGLLVWRVNDSVIQAGMASNRVNADSAQQGLHLVQGDGLGELEKAPSGGGNRGNAGDPVPGSTNKMKLDSTTTPPLPNAAICGISISQGVAKFTTIRGATTCP